MAIFERQKWTGLNNIYAFLVTISSVTQRVSKQAVSPAGYLDNSGQLGQKDLCTVTGEDEVLRGSCAVLGDDSATEASQPPHHLGFHSLVFLRDHFGVIWA